jgi:DinB superfamily
MRRAAQVSEALRAVSASAEQLTRTVSAEQFVRRPGPEKWSAAECLAHLAVSANVYEPVWHEAYGTAQQRGTRGSEPYRMDFAGRLLNWLLEPGRFRFTAPAKFRPVDHGSMEEVLAAFLKSQEMVLGFIAEGADLPLDRMMIASPAAANMRYSVWSSFVILATHGRRHLRQAAIALQGRIP